jgi:uncharacterized membrane protein YqjE
MNVSNLEHQPAPVPTRELVKEALDGAKELVQLEVALALDEVREDVQRLKKVAIFSGVALVFANLFLATLIFSIVLALGGTPEVAFATTGLLALIAVVLSGVAYKLFPGMPLRRTIERVKNDMNQLREHVA